jgi:hypothetical protein
MTSSRPSYLKVLIFVCRLLSIDIAIIHVLFVKIRFLKVSSIISNAPGNLYKKLQWIWFVRCFRRCLSVLVRTPFRKDVLGLINFNPDSIHPGSIVVSCHTPWARLITQWCVENNYAMIVGWGP